MILVSKLPGRYGRGCVCAATGFQDLRWMGVIWVNDQRGRLRGGATGRPSREEGGAGLPGTGRGLDRVFVREAERLLVDDLARGGDHEVSRRPGHAEPPHKLTAHRVVDVHPDHLGLPREFVLQPLDEGLSSQALRSGVREELDEHGPSVRPRLLEDRIGF